MHWLGIHVDDGLGTAWEALIQYPDTRVTQIMVRLKDGTDLFCKDALRYAQTDKPPWAGLADFCPKFGTDGAVVMVVEEEEEQNGDAPLERTAMVDDHFGCRMTYIPADQIERVEMRLKDA